MWPMGGATVCAQMPLLTSRRVPVRVSHVAIGQSSKELAKQNLWILAILAKSIKTFPFLEK